eukprot:superscaffoldBa00004771_g19421
MVLFGSRKKSFSLAFRAVLICCFFALPLLPPSFSPGDSPPGLSKEIASALSHVPGFEMDPFSLDDTLRMDPMALDMLDGDLMLADPAELGGTSELTANRSEAEKTGISAASPPTHHSPTPTPPKQTVYRASDVTVYSGTR